MQKLLKVVLCLFLILSTECDRIPRVATEKEYKAFKKLSKLSSFVAMDSINPEAFSMNPEENVALRENYDVIAIVYVVIKAVCALYKGIVALFGHRVSYSYTEVPMEKGYSQLTQRVRITYSAEVKPGEDCKDLAEVAESLCDIADIPANSKYYKSVYRAFENAKYSDSKVWGKKDFLFSNQKGEATYVSVMISKQDDEGYVYPSDKGAEYEEPLCADHENYFILFIYMKMNLKLSSNAIIERKEEHWGVWRDKTSSKIIEKPRGIENEDIDALFYFFNLLALKALAGKYQVEYQAPVIKTSTDTST